MPNDQIPALGANTLPDGEADQLRSLIETWTEDLVTGHSSEWRSFWAEDAVLMPPGHERITGLDKISDFVTQAFKPGLSDRFSNWSFTGREDLAVVTNRIALSGEGSDAATSFNQMIVLRRDSEQRWRIQTVIFTPTAG